MKLRGKVPIDEIIQRGDDTGVQVRNQFERSGNCLLEEAEGPENE
jgi:hypothetical protein